VSAGVLSGSPTAPGAGVRWPVGVLTPRTPAGG
jgi:hypothetical protein